MDTIFVKDVLTIRFESEADIEDFTYHLIAKASGRSYQQILDLTTCRVWPPAKGVYAGCRPAFHYGGCRLGRLLG